MDNALYTIHELIRDIDEEGGFESMIEYGIVLEEYDIPKHIKVLWAEMQELYWEFACARDYLSTELNTLADETPGY